MRKLLSKMFLELGKCPNQEMHEMESAGFLPEVQYNFRKQFSQKVLYTYCFKFLWSVSVSILKSKKIDFPLYFQKVIWPM